MKPQTPTNRVHIIHSVPEPRPLALTLQHASILLHMLHPSPQLAFSRPLTTLTIFPWTDPGAPRALQDPSGDRFLRPVSERICFQLYKGFVSTTEVSFCCHLTGKKTCLENRLLFLSLRGTPPWSMLSVEAGSLLLPSWWCSLTWHLGGAGLYADVNKGLPVVIQGLPFPSPQQASLLPPTAFYDFDL